MHKEILCILVCSNCKQRALIINIDEFWFNRDLKNNFSWVKKGQTNESKSIQFSGSWNIVMAIRSNRTTFTLLSNEATDSVKFWLFSKAWIVGLLTIKIFYFLILFL